MERVVSVTFSPSYDSETVGVPYKSFFDVNTGDYVIVKSSHGFRVAQVVDQNLQVPESVLSDLDYLVQSVNDLPYRHYTEKNSKIREIKSLISGMSAEELDDILEAMKYRMNK